VSIGGYVYKKLKHDFKLVIGAYASVNQWFKWTVVLFMLLA